MSISERSNTKQNNGRDCFFYQDKDKTREEYDYCDLGHWFDKCGNNCNDFMSKKDKLAVLRYQNIKIKQAIQVSEANLLKLKEQIVVNYDEIQRLLEEKHSGSSI
jgi:hypothetical protein